MDKTCRNIVYGTGIFTAVLLLSLGIGIAWSSVDLTRRTCIVSTVGAVLKEIDASDPPFPVSVRELTRDEITSLLGTNVSDQDSCHFFYNYTEFHMAITKIDKKGRIVGIRAWGHGADGISGTADDMIAIP